MKQKTKMGSFQYALGAARAGMLFNLFSGKGIYRLGLEYIDQVISYFKPNKVFDAAASFYQL